jgi:hypothetical protein
MNFFANLPHAPLADYASLANGLLTVYGSIGLFRNNLCVAPFETLERLPDGYSTPSRQHRTPVSPFC